MDEKNEAREQGKPTTAQRARRISYAKLPKVVQARISLTNVERLAMLNRWEDHDLTTGLALVRKGLEAIERREAN